MNGKYDKVIFLSIEEFLIIMYKFKIEGLIFPKELSEVEADANILNRALNNLVKDGYVRFVEESLELSEDTRKWAEALLRAHETIVISGMQGFSGLQYYYVTTGETVIIRLDEHRKGWIRIEYIDDKDVLDQEIKNSNAPLTIRKYSRGQTDSYVTIKE